MTQEQQEPQNVTAATPEPSSAAPPPAPTNTAAAPAPTSTAATPAPTTPQKGRAAAGVSNQPASLKKPDDKEAKDTLDALLKLCKDLNDAVTGLFNATAKWIINPKKTKLSEALNKAKEKVVETANALQDAAFKASNTIAEYANKGLASDTDSPAGPAGRAEYAISKLREVTDSIKNGFQPEGEASKSLKRAKEFYDAAGKDLQKFAKDMSDELIKGFEKVFGRSPAATEDASATTEAERDDDVEQAAQTASSAAKEPVDETDIDAQIETTDDNANANTPPPADKRQSPQELPTPRDGNTTQPESAADISGQLATNNSSAAASHTSSQSQTTQLLSTTEPKQQTPAGQNQNLGPPANTATASEPLDKIETLPERPNPQGGGSQETPSPEHANKASQPSGPSSGGM